MQSTSIDSTVSTHIGNPQCESRPVESIQETNVRIDNPQDDVPDCSTKTGEGDEDGCFHRSSQLPITKLLGFREDPFATFNQNWKRKGLYMFPPWKLIQKMKQDKTKEAILVTPLWKSQFWFPIILQMKHTPGSSHNMECEQPMEFNHLEVISDKRKTDGLNHETIEHLSKKTRSSTSKAYNAYWRKYATWHRKQKCDPKTYNIQQILEFLVDNRNKSYYTLNGYRSAVASVLTILHPNNMPIANSRDVVDFFKAKRRGDVQIKKTTQLEKWDVDTLIQYIRSNLSPSFFLNLYDLQQKVMILLYIHTMWRPRSDIGRLQHRDTDIIRNQASREAEAVALQIREPKESQQKHIKLGFLEDKEQKEVCVVTTLLLFLQKTRFIRESLPIDHNLLLASLNQTDATKI